MACMSLDGDYSVGADGTGGETAVASVETEVVVGQTIQGTDNDDIFIGGGGDDILDGGAGQNTLTGGEGADTFVLGSIDIADVITDYSSEEGDEIDLSGLLGDSGANAEGIPLGQFVRVVAQGNDEASLEVDTAGGGNCFSQVAKLQGIGLGDTVRVIIDDDGGSNSGDIVV